MSQSKKRALVSLLVLSLVIGTGAILYWTSPDSLLLTRRATRIAILPYPDMYYAWTSDHQFMMYWRFSTRLAPHKIGLEGLPTLVDTRTGTKIALEEFRRRVGDALEYSDITISPDGSCVLLKKLGHQEVMPVPVDDSSLTKHIINRKKLEYAMSNAVWMPGSTQYVQLFQGEKSFNAAVEDLDTDGIVRIVPLGYPQVTIGYYQLNWTILLGSTQTGSILATSGGANQGAHSQRQINFFEFRADGGPARLHEYTISIPKSAMDPDSIGLSPGEEVVLSPRGDRLAWIIYVVQERSALSRWLARWMPSLIKAPRPRIEIRTCGLDDSDMRVIGYLETNPNPAYYQEPVIHSLRWLPDGQNLSFLYRDALWKIPVDR